VNRAGLVVVLLGAIFAGSVFFVLTTRTPDDPGDGATPDAAAVPDRPPRAETSSPEATGPAPAAPEPPAAPRAPRRTAPAAREAAPADPPPARETATLRVTSDVPGAQVFLNREFVGATPASKEDLAPGAYELNVSAPGFDNHVERLELYAGSREINIRFREVRLDASVDVVHKHRFGSCRGTLSATPQGVRYSTTHKEDAFTVPFGDLQTFEVDYLDKNLRVQARKGRRYDFTDPDGNADRLFVFHRDVERARERLMKGDTP
jgi:hypothetical protein